MGLDDWPVEQGVTEISEPRLLKAVQHELGPQVAKLLTPPVSSESTGRHGQPVRRHGERRRPGRPVPPLAGLPLLPVAGPDPVGPLRACGSTPTARTGAGTSTGSARSRASRPRWSRPGSSWPASTGTSTTSRGSSSSTGARPTAATSCGSTNWGPRARSPTSRSQCVKCESKRRLSEAFSDEGREELAKCKGRWPHLRKYDEDACEGRQRAILLGASNSWFPIMLSVLSIPSTTDKLGQLVELNWAELEECESGPRGEAQAEAAQGARRLHRGPDLGGGRQAEGGQRSGRGRVPRPAGARVGGLLEPRPEPQRPGLQAPGRRAAQGVPQGLDEGRPRRAAAGGPCPDRVHPDRVAGRLHRDRRLPQGAAGAAEPEGPEVGAHVRDPGRGGLPPVLGAGHRGVGQEDRGAGGRVLRGPQAVAEEPGPGARTTASRRCGTCCCTRWPTP